MNRRCHVIVLRVSVILTLPAQCAQCGEQQEIQEYSGFPPWCSFLMKEIQCTADLVHECMTGLNIRDD